MTIDNNYQICFPTGGGGNHLRWLMFLDNSIISDLLPDSPSKLNFIKTEIYPEHRKWFNWLYYEGKFNNAINNNFIGVHHNLYGWEEDLSWEDKNILYMDFTDAQLPYRHIMQMMLNGQHISTAPAMTFTNTIVFDEITRWINELNLIKNSNRLTSTKKIINADCMFDRVLSRELYDEIRAFFNLSDDRYDEANQVHQLYYAARVRSAKEYYSYFSSDLFASTLQHIKEFSNNVI